MLLKKGSSYLCFIILLFIFTGCARKDGLPDLRETYAFRDSRPFGGNIAYKMLQNGFPDNYVQVIKEPFAKTAAIINDTTSLYFCASRNLFVDENDVIAILNYVYDGNTAFFTSSNFDTAFLKKLFCAVMKDDKPGGNGYGMWQPSSVRLIEGIHTSKDSFGYYYLPFSSYFSATNDIYCRIAGYNTFGNPDCIVFFWGKGKLFLHTDPRAFSNYFLLTGNNYRYIQELLQVTVTSPAHVYWDDYYNKLNRPENARSGSGMMSEISGQPALYMAFWLLLLMLLLFILFGIKRKQRAMEQVKQNSNSSVAFTETVSRLYLQKHDNKNIAEKMITYFYEYIRNNYYLQVHPGSRDFISSLSRKSGMPEEKTSVIFEAIIKAGESEVIDDRQLLTLNREIQQFYKKRK